jgi:hypothetical protein
MSTLMSSRVNPRFKMASTAASAATLLLKSPVTNFGLAIQSSPRKVRFNNVEGNSCAYSVTAARRQIALKIETLWHLRN